MKKPWWVPCPVCKGSGKIDEKNCSRCSGSGEIDVNAEIEPASNSEAVGVPAEVEPYLKLNKQYLGVSRSD